MGLPPVTINVSRCWPHLVDQSKSQAEYINHVITTSNNPRAAELRQRFEKSMTDTANANLCPFVPGNGSIMAESNAVLQLAKDIETILTPEEEMQILAANMPTVRPPKSFLRRNMKPILIGGGAILFGTLGMILLLR